MEPLQKQPRRVIGFDLLNICACICVVAMHVNSAVWTFSYNRNWITSMVIETVCFWAAPGFIMLSGATLMDYRERYDTKTFFRRRLLRAGLPFLFWSLAAVAWAYLRRRLDPSFTFGFASVFDLVFNCKALGIYWFFPSLFGVYLSIPALTLIPAEKRRRAFSYLALYAFVTISCLPLLCQLLHIDFTYSWMAPMCGGMLIYALLGWLLSAEKLSRRTRWLFYLAGVAGWALRFFCTIRLSYAAGSFDQTFSGATNLPAVLQTAGVFVWFVSRDWSFLSGARAQKVLRAISGASLGVYLIHFYLLDAVVSYFDINVFTWQWRVLGTLLIYGVTLCAVLAMKRIPVVRRLVP